MNWFLKWWRTQEIVVQAQGGPPIIGTHFIGLWDASKGRWTIYSLRYWLSDQDEWEEAIASSTNGEYAASLVRTFDNWMERNSANGSL